MKESWIVVAGWNSQKKSPPIYDEGEANRYCDEVNKFIKDPMDKARVEPLPKDRETPRKFAESLDEVTPKLDFGSAPEFGDTMGKGVAPQTGRGFTDQIGIDWGPGTPAQDGPGEDEVTDEELDAAFDDSVIADDIDDTEPNKGD